LSDDHGAAELLIRNRASVRKVPLLLFLICGCSTTSTTLQYRAAEEEKIAEMLLLDSLASENRSEPILVTFRGPNWSFIDPSNAAMARIRGAGFDVRKASEAGSDQSQRRIHYAGVVRWLNNSKVEAVRGIDCGSLCGGFIEFLIEKKGGKWTQTKTKRSITI
jgi:hypothetical protein